jgi:hypothetical protein
MLDLEAKLPQSQIHYNTRNPYDQRYLVDYHYYELQFQV